MFPYMYQMQGLQYLIPAMLISLLAQGLISSRYSKYKTVNSNLNLTGAEVAKTILKNNGIGYMPVSPVRGQLTDHFDPRTESISLSQEIYSGTSVASIAVAAHEVGHALQYANNYIPLKLRSALVPVTNFATQISFVFLFLGLLINPQLANIGILLFSFSFIFQLVTLPVEINASRRALAELEKIGISEETAFDSKKMLSAAALTYVAALITALMQLLRIISIFGNNNRRDG